MQTMRSSPGHKNLQWYYLKWRRWKAQRKKQAVLSTACLKNTSAFKGYQETQKNQAGRMRVYYSGFRN